jgi:F-type H+-transporting ATPase subunit a
MAIAIQAPTLASETIFHVGSFAVRNTMIMAWLAMAVLIVCGLALRSTGYKLVPGRFQMLAEMVVMGLYDFFDSILHNPSLTRRIFPLVATLFVFIITANWMGIFPGVGSITVQGMHEGHSMAMPIFRSMNADVNMTLALALIVTLYAQFLGMKTLGVGAHLGKFFVAPWKKPYAIGTFVGLLEFLGEFTRIVSFSFRLFGNIFAGEVLLVVVSTLVPFLAPLPFLGLEVFVGFIQALVFTMLTIVFIAMATAHHGEHAH